MPRSLLFQTPRDERQRLHTLRLFFAWAYKEYDTRDALVRDFTRWFARVAPEQIALRRVPDADTWRRQLLSWPWDDLRREWLALLKGYIESARRGGSPEVSGVPYILCAHPGTRRRWYFAIHYVLPEEPDPARYQSYVFDLLLRLLDGLAWEAIRICRYCGRLFVRRRAKRQLYCSARCKYEGAPSTRKLRAQQRARRKASTTPVPVLGPQT